MKSIMEDKNAQESLFFAGPGAELEFCIVRPGGLKSEPPNGIVNIVEQAGAINRADVAAFCLDAVLEEDFKFLKQAVSISSDMVRGTPMSSAPPAARDLGSSARLSPLAPH